MDKDSVMFFAVVLAIVSCVFLMTQCNIKERCIKHNNCQAMGISKK